jgi:glycine/D-amino acid oxidase-like deaminating enzyme
MSESYDAIIIKAGIIGCATALVPGRTGRKVLDRERLRGVNQNSNFSVLE